MVKHAGCVPQCAIAFEKLWPEAGAPAGAYTNLLISHDQVERAVAGGATLVMGGKRFDRPGSFMQPPILVNIQPGNPAFREEFLGR
jgi:acyl-CoA reductase-like NAD-dependent aldehyde dehydrogenase